MSDGFDWPWKDAIRKALDERRQPMHYTDIAKLIEKRGHRKALGATPATSVNVTLRHDIKTNGDDSEFVQVARGIYALRGHEEIPVGDSTESAEVLTGAVSEDDADEDSAVDDDSGAVCALGMFWRRDRVIWSSSPRIYGAQSEHADPVDFGGQRGVYLLHDGSRVVYAGRAAKQPIGRRLGQHTSDRLEGRWDRFSWFGTRPVHDDGSLGAFSAAKISEVDLITAFEALLIEALEPPQNRRRGDGLSAVEYIQREDPQLKTQRMKQLLAELSSKMD